ncbi:MAG: hypothetical protein JF593_05635 [Novosphingobium sp.]|nr:hypothetical protein [Novosphingobium sp.]
MHGTDTQRIDFVRGDATGLAIPAHPEALSEAGAVFLTQAFHAFGSLDPDNSVERIAAIEPCPGGSTGQKLYLTVEYARPDPSLDTELFVKFSRDFGDAIRDLQRGEMASEVHLAELSRHAAFPITVPHTWFADFHQASQTGLIITSRIFYGRDAIEPQRMKCMDHELADPLQYYRAIMTALGRLAAAHKSGRLSPEVERTFPFDPEVAAAGDPIPYDAEQLTAQIGRYADLADRAPQLFPPHLADPAFIERFDAQAQRVLAHEAAIKRFLHADSAYVALCHWNANIDNAWFWRDEGGALQCGLIDWGHVRQLNLAYPLWGSLCAAPRALWDDHLDELIGLFIGEIQANGGPRLHVDELKLHLDLYMAVKGLSGMLVAPDRILYRLPSAVDASGPRDPIFNTAPQARNFLHIFTNLVNMWERHDFGASLDRMLTRIG